MLKLEHVRKVAKEAKAKLELEQAQRNEHEKQAAIKKIIGEIENNILAIAEQGRFQYDCGFPEEYKEEILNHFNEFKILEQPLNTVGIIRITIKW